MEIEVKVESIDPKLASIMLENMIENRKVSKVRVTSYARAMANGEWRNNGETIKLSPEFKLVDGQHRLRAVIESGCTVEFLVAYNVTLDMVPTIDAGKPRSAADYLAMVGTNYARELAAVARMLTMYNDRISGATARGVQGGLTNTEIIKVLTDNPGIENYAPQAGRVANETGIPRSVVHTAIYLTRGGLRWVEFWGGVESGVNLQIGDSRRHLRRIGRNLDRRRRGSMRLHLLGLMIKSWNIFNEERSIQILVLRQDEPFPKVRIESEDE